MAHGAKVGARIMYIDAFSPTPLFLLYATSCTLSQQYRSLSPRVPESPVCTQRGWGVVARRPPSSRRSAVLPSSAFLLSSRRPSVIPPSSRRPTCPLGCCPSPLLSSRYTMLRLNTLPDTRTHPPNTRYPRKIPKTTATYRFLTSYKRWLTSFSL